MEQPVGGTKNQQNPDKRFNNCNVCSSYGWDTPLWHTCVMCPREYFRPGHLTNCDRGNEAGMITTGHAISQKEMHKARFPQKPHPGFEWRLGTAMVNANRNESYIWHTKLQLSPNNTIVIRNMIYIKEKESHYDSNATVKYGQKWKNNYKLKWRIWQTP